MSGFTWLLFDLWCGTPNVSSSVTIKSKCCSFHLQSGDEEIRWKSQRVALMVFCEHVRNPSWAHLPIFQMCKENPMNGASRKLGNQNAETFESDPLILKHDLFKFRDCLWTFSISIQDSPYTFGCWCLISIHNLTLLCSKIELLHEQHTWRMADRQSGSPLQTAIHAQLSIHLEKSLEFPSFKICQTAHIMKRSAWVPYGNDK